MKKMLIMIAAFFFSLSVYAQSADFVTEMLTTKAANYGQVCYLSAVYQGLIDEKATYPEAVKALYDNNQLPYVVDSEIPVNLGNLSFILSKLWPINGGLMFHITRGSPRYAFRQLKADRLIDADADPVKKVSGSEVLNLYTECQQKYAGSEEK